jgi:hypothetical protein
MNQLAVKRTELGYTITFGIAAKNDSFTPGEPIHHTFRARSTPAGAKLANS